MVRGTKLGNPSTTDLLSAPAIRMDPTRTHPMRKIIAIAAALGFLASTSLPTFAAPATNGVVKSDDLSAAKKKKKKMEKKDEKKIEKKDEKKSDLDLNDLSAKKKKKKAEKKDEKKMEKKDEKKS